MRYLILSFFILFTGCESFKKNYLQEPKAELKEVKVQDVGLNGATLVFVLEVMNPNKSALDVGDVSYQTYLNDKYFSEAKVEKVHTIPAEKSALIELPLPVAYNKLSGGIARVLSGEDVTYRVKGNAKLSMFRIPFDKTGKFKLKD